MTWSEKGFLSLIVTCKLLLLFLIKLKKKNTQLTTFATKQTYKKTGENRSQRLISIYLLCSYKKVLIENLNISYDIKIQHSVSLLCFDNTYS